MKKNDVNEEDSPIEEDSFAIQQVEVPEDVSDL